MEVFYAKYGEWAQHHINVNSQVKHVVLEVES